MDSMYLGYIVTPLNSPLSQNILGPYDACKDAIQSNLVQLLGTVEATPSTPLHATGNPFDKQFAKSLSSSIVTGTTNLAAKTITSVASSSSSSVSVAQSRAELNRHSVAEPPNTSKEEKSGGRSRVGHGRSDHSGSAAVKMNRQSSGSHFSAPKSTHKKVSSKTKDETSSEGGPRPTNMLVVKKPKDKGRVRPFKTPGSPTGNQQGATGLKKSATPSQGAVDLFKVETELSGVKSTPDTVTPHPRAPTPPVTSKKQPKLKKKHSHHHLPTAAPTSSPATESQLILPSASLSSTQKSLSHSSSTSTLQPTSTSQRNRKPSSSVPQPALPTHSSSSSSTPIAKKQGSNLPPSQSHHHNPTTIPPLHSDKERTSSNGVIKSESSQGGSAGAAATSLAQIGSSGAGFSEEKPTKRKKKKTKKEKGHVQESDKSKVKTVPADKMECTVESSDPIQHSQSSTTASNFYISSSSQQQMTSLGHSTLTSQPQPTSQAGSKITLENLSKQRPSNLSIE